MNYEIKTYSKTGEPDVQIPFADGKAQLPIPQGYSETKKEISFGGVLREPDQAKATVTESRNIRTGLKLPERDLTPVGPKGIFLKKDPFQDNAVSTEPPGQVDQNNINRLKEQLKKQYGSIRSASDYRYKNENELEYIFDKQATQLASYGINDLRDIGLEEIPGTKRITNVKEKNGVFYKEVPGSENTGDLSSFSKIKPDDIANVERNEDGTLKAINLKDAPVRYLINKETGKRLQTREDHGGLTNRGWGYRWGWDNSVEGSVDFGIEFVDGNAVMIPVYKDTSSDLTPLVMAATFALMAAGVPAQIGQALAPTTAAVGPTATQLAVGNAVVSASVAALTGQNVVKAAALGGISGYAAGTLTPQFNTSIGESILGKGVTGAQTLGSVVSNSMVNGVMASIAGQDVGKAMLMGGVTGGVAANAKDITKALVGEKGINDIARTTNLTTSQVQKILSSSIVTGARALVTNQDFFSAVTDHLLVQGLSTSATNAVVDGLRNNISKDNLVRIGNVTKLSTSVFIQAQRKGLDPVRVLQQAYPAIVIRAMQ